MESSESYLAFLAFGLLVSLGFLTSFGFALAFPFAAVEETGPGEGIVSRGGRSSLLSTVAAAAAAAAGAAEVEVEGGGADEEEVAGLEENPLRGKRGTNPEAGLGLAAEAGFAVEEEVEAAGVVAEEVVERPGMVSRGGRSSSLSGLIFAFLFDPGDWAGLAIDSRGGISSSLPTPSPFVAAAPAADASLGGAEFVAATAPVRRAKRSLARCISVGMMSEG